MTSVLRHQAQRDTRVEDVTLYGYINDNGFKSGPDNVQHPAYAAIDLRKAKTFTVDTTVLTLRTDDPDATYMVNIYLDSTKPPLYYPNFEFTIMINLKN